MRLETVPIRLEKNEAVAVAWLKEKGEARMSGRFLLVYYETSETDYKCIWTICKEYGD